MKFYEIPVRIRIYSELHINIYLLESRKLHLKKSLADRNTFPVMEQNGTILLTTAILIGFLHTLAGPDHYLPFVAMSKTGNWSMTKTINIIIICGLLHVLSSIAIGFIGIAAGIAISKITIIESIRGNIAAWLLFLFGIVYTVWGIFHLIRHNTHTHSHSPIDPNKQMTYWVLFTVFVFGPCEPLIPLLMYPAAKHNYWAVALISGVFALVTIATMLIVSIILIKGIQLFTFSFIEKYQHIMAGATLSICGAAILFLGL